MLRLLTDEQISPAVARQLGGRGSGVSIESIHFWNDGKLMGCPDEVVMEAARLEGMTLVTYDLRTIPTLLRAWAEQGIDHGGIVFVDERTIAQNSIGGLVVALRALWKAQHTLVWTNRVVYLSPARARLM